MQTQLEIEGELESFVQNQVALGLYESPEDAIRNLLWMAKYRGQMEPTSLEELRAGVLRAFESPKLEFNADEINAIAEKELLEEG